ncbi:Protein dgcr6 [Characodon lateralis]|uniref:Protein dgcr6 n=1 Tax=Characodon lateralis TaxID=208331 RepID=A0ABU7DAL8_9TELE|nr:Protein dgcr6 [Characodon lateralis]
MDVYPGVTDSDPTKLQERHYYLLSELQTLVKDLPSSFQQRLTYNTLSDLALALIDGTVYEIVQGLLDIQHLTEKNLYNQRLKLHCEHQALKQDLVRKHKEALQSCKSHNLALLKSTQQTEVEACRSKLCSREFPAETQSLRSTVELFSQSGNRTTETASPW